MERIVRLGGTSMKKVTTLVSKDQQRVDDVCSEYPGFKPTHDRFCSKCNDYVRTGTLDCHTEYIRTLSALQAQDATIYNLTRYG